MEPGAFGFRDAHPFPESFLQGCGVSDRLIEFARGEQGAIQFYSCFISYTVEDEEFAKRLHADLQDNGVRCWFSPEDLKEGDPILFHVNEAIRLHDKLIVILSERSIAKQWPEHEVTKALEQEKERGKPVLCLVRLDDEVFNCTLGWAKAISDATKPTGRLIGDFTDWKNHDTYKVAFERLLKNLKRDAIEPVSD